MAWRLLVGTLVLLGLAGARYPDQPAVGLRVAGNRLVDGADRVVALRGVNVPGTEYACTWNPGAYAPAPLGPATARLIATRWYATAVRVPLNEDCWLGINGLPSAISAAQYRSQVAAWVQAITDQGLAAIVDLHWSAPGASRAVGQQPLPDRDHAPDFWRSVAATFRNNGAVLFDLFNEPAPNGNADDAGAWRCLRDGGTACTGVPYVAAGMQELVDAVRSTGARNVILIGGVHTAGMLSQVGAPGATPLWLAYAPHDPVGNLVASWHAYDHGPCDNTSCWEATIAPLAQRVPVVVGECCDTDGTANLAARLLPWLDAHRIGYLAWEWIPWTQAARQALIVDSGSGAPTPIYGQDYLQHLRSLHAGDGFAALFNDVGISGDTMDSVGAFDTLGFSYSATALAAVGVVAGRRLRVGDVTFQWPDTAPGTADNIIAGGQTIIPAAPLRGRVLAFLGAADWGPSSGTAILHFSDGKALPFRLGFADWTLSGNPSATPAYGNRVVATAAYRNHNTIQDHTATLIFYTEVPLPRGTAVTGVTLPATVDHGRLHIFAMAASSVPGS